MISSRAMWWLDFVLSALCFVVVANLTHGDFIVLCVLFLAMSFQFYQGTTYQARVVSDRIRKSPPKSTAEESQDEQVPSDQSEVGV